MVNPIQQSVALWAGRRMCLAALVLLMAGCDDGGNSLSVSEVRHWNIPAEGTRIPAPRALHVDADNQVLALDNAGRVLVYSDDGQLQRHWWMPDHETGRPEGIVRLQDGRIAVADTHYHRVVVFADDGRVDEMFGEKGTDAGQFVYPVAITQDPQGFIYVGEYGDRQRIQKFTADWQFVVQFGEHGTGPGQFQRPSGITWSDGTIYAVDAFNNRIQVFSDDGRFLRIFELPDNLSPLEFPYDVRGTDDGRLYVVENKAARLTVLRQDGSLVGRYGRPGRGLGEFFNPWSLAVLPDGRILVADTGNHRIVELIP